jgi:hypothetical protein
MLTTPVPLGLKAAPPYRLQMDEGEEEEPVSPWAKGLAWAAIILYNLAFGFYICLFG